MTETVELEGPSWRVVVAPAAGGSLVAAEGLFGGRFVRVTRDIAADAVERLEPRALAGFLMAPFCNRLDAPRLVPGGGATPVPPNWPADPAVAIHGRSWRRAFETEHREAALLVLRHTVDEPDYPFQYEMQVLIDARGDHLVFRLEVTHRGTLPMPYGLGHHPYLRRTPEASIRFDATSALEADSRKLPVRSRPLEAGADIRTGAALHTLAGLDQTFAGWSGAADLGWPELGCRLRLTADAPARLIHVYVPATDPSFVCLEPVTHIVDVINRPHFAPLGAMATLAPGQSLALTTRWALGELHR